MVDQMRRTAVPAAQESTPEAAANGVRHVAIIMDGNGRWATKRGLPRVAGHRAGMEALRKTVRAARELGVAMLTVYAFSTENWKRPAEEVGALMWLIVEYCRSELRELQANGVRINVIGRWNDLPELQREVLAESMADTRENTGLMLNLALNYGAQAEIADAFQAILAEVQAGRLRPEDVDPACIEDHLYTGGLPNPDLIIRTAGEMRLSNFLLWQAAYAEFWVTPDFWPDFSRTHLEAALRDFGRRERRFGAILEQSR